MQPQRFWIDNLRRYATIHDLKQRRLDPYGGYLCFKLDWIAGKHVRALSPGEKRDERTGVESLAPGCRTGPNTGPDRVSDHLPIYADVDLNLRKSDINEPK